MKHKLIIGSSAMQNFVPELVVNDIDAIVSFDHFQEIVKQHKLDSKKLLFIDDSHVASMYGDLPIEYEIAFDGTSASDILEYCSVHDSKADYLNVLLMLKMSHRFKDSVHFEKTMDDIYIMSANGAFIPDDLKPIYEKRVQETLSSTKKISLNVSKDDFFSGDGVNYVYDHDALHEIFTLGEFPAYKNFLDGHDVLCSEKLFHVSTEENRIHSVMEEALVISFERGIAPFSLYDADKDKQKRLVKMALQKICTTLTSGFFRRFAWDNYYKCLTFLYMYIDNGNYSSILDNFKNGHYNKFLNKKGN
jgi:hypothetical protein